MLSFTQFFTDFKELFQKINDKFNKYQRLSEDNVNDNTNIALGDGVPYLYLAPYQKDIPIEAGVFIINSLTLNANTVGLGTYKLYLGKRYDDLTIDYMEFSSTIITEGDVDYVFPYSVMDLNETYLSELVNTYVFKAVFVLDGTIDEIPVLLYSANISLTIKYQPSSYIVLPNNFLGNEIYVANDGDDNNNGLSVEQRVATIEQAIFLSKHYLTSKVIKSQIILYNKELPQTFDIDGLIFDNLNNLIIKPYMEFDVDDEDDNFVKLNFNSTNLNNINNLIFDNLIIDNILNINDSKVVDFNNSKIVLDQLRINNSYDINYNNVSFIYLNMIPVVDSGTTTGSLINKYIWDQASITVQYYMSILKINTIRLLGYDSSNGRWVFKLNGVEIYRTGQVVFNQETVLNNVDINIDFMMKTKTSSYTFTVNFLFNNGVETGPRDFYDYSFNRQYILGDYSLISNKSYINFIENVKFESFWNGLAITDLFNTNMLTINLNGGQLIGDFYSNSFLSAPFVNNMRYYETIDIRKQLSKIYANSFEKSIDNITFYKYSENEYYARFKMRVSSLDLRYNSPNNINHVMYDGMVNPADYLLGAYGYARADGDVQTSSASYSEYKLFYSYFNNSLEFTFKRFQGGTASIAVAYNKNGIPIACEIFTALYWDDYINSIVRDIEFDFVLVWYHEGAY